MTISVAAYNGLVKAAREKFFAAHNVKDDGEAAYAYNVEIKNMILAYQAYQAEIALMSDIIEKEI